MLAIYDEKLWAQRKAPLYAAVRSHLQKKYGSLHVPLHGGGAGAPDLQRSGLSAVLRWDLTEVGDLDDLHLPQGAIGQAQKLAATLFGAESTFFLVNGVTGGLLALFSAFCRPGEKVLLTRLSHKAVLHGIALCGARPVYLPVERERRSGFPLNISAKTVAAALREHPEARLLLVTSPSYWGVTADLEAIRRVTARHGVILAVDEAHGAHLSFYRKKLPHSAVAGADIWLQSAHKSLGSLTPGAFLHLGPGARPFASTLKFWLQALQTSSPSYPLLVSLDLARRQAALKGKTLFSAAWSWARRLRWELSNSGFTLLEPEQKKGDEFKLDPCRVTILCPHGEGEILARELAQSYRWQTEMSGRGYLLAIVSPAHLSFSPCRLARAMQGARARMENKLSVSGSPAAKTRRKAGFSFSRRSAAAGNRIPRARRRIGPAGRFKHISRTNYASRGTRTGRAKRFPVQREDFPPSFFRRAGDDLAAGYEGTRRGTFPASTLPPEEALRRPGVDIPLAAAAGKICKEMIVLSPPGIPLLAPGETIHTEVLKHIAGQRAKGKLFQGAADPTLRTIKVVREDAGMIE